MSLQKCPREAFSCPLGTYGDPPEGLELQVGEVLRQLFRFQVVKEQGDFPFLAGVRFYPLSKFPGPVTGIAFVGKCERENGGKEYIKTAFEYKSVQFCTSLYKEPLAHFPWPKLCINSFPKSTSSMAATRKPGWLPANLYNAHGDWGKGA